MVIRQLCINSINFNIDKISYWKKVIQSFLQKYSGQHFYFILYYPYHRV